jgi:alpha-glucosidase
MKALLDWTLFEQSDSGITLLVERRHWLRIQILDEQLFRVSLLKDGAWRLDRSWTVSPDGDIPWTGRNRDSLAGFTRPPFKLVEGDPLRIETKLISLSIHKPLRLEWSVRIEGEWRQFAEDRPTGAIMLGRADHAVAHFMRHNESETIYGLGEKSGPLNRAGRRFEMRNLNTFGYDARHTDPLYKHVPFTITRTTDAGCWSIFYDNFANCWFDLGNELDHYHAPYRSYRAEDGDLDYYLRWEPDILELTQAQVRLTGGTAFPPRWSLGYSGSTMAYTDASNAESLMMGFLEELQEHEIPCDSFHLSSGYTSIDGKRYVFNWNTDKFPDPAGLARAFADRGVKLIANIKPCLLNDHPRYPEVEAINGFVRDSETGQAEMSSFWGGRGSHLDFTNPDTINWWKRNVTSQLLENGILSTWNDNNEYEIWDRSAQCDGFGEPLDIALIRPLHSQFMCRASSEAQQAFAPDKRPYLISRSAAPGLQRYAQTWTGDNHTDWDTLRWNIRMGLGLSLSGFYNVGHDVGGFAGPKPDPELFLRWVQNGIFHPRFTIHSWNDDRSVNEPWMYPEVTAAVREAIQLRYCLLPYLYTCLWQAVSQDVPMLRPTFLNYPEDRKCERDCDEFMLGTDLLVANVVEPGQMQRAIYLPDNDQGWWDFSNQCWYAGGQEIEMPVRLESIPLFVRAGAVLPLSKIATRARAGRETGRELMVFPLAADGESESYLFEDDGESLNSPHSLLHFSLTNRDGNHSLGWIQQGNGAPTFDRAELIVAGGSRVDVQGINRRSGNVVTLD